MKSDDVWITEEEYDIFYEDNVQVEQPLGESDSGSNINLEDLEDDGGGSDINNYLIKGLIDI
ncbi:hypothetical protein GmHk_04G009269 [Glycine max]|nr:hypothetical protein GmHk_04G009269 [Glycine max]